MNKIGFFTAVRYSDNLKLSTGESALQTVDNYFYLGGKKAHVITGEDTTRKAILSGTNSSLIARAIKVASYFTVILPLILLTVKTALRYSLRDTYDFTLINPTQKLVAKIDQTNVPAKICSALIDDVVQDITAKPCGDYACVEVTQWSGRLDSENIPWLATKVGDRVEIMLTGEDEGDLKNVAIIIHVSNATVEDPLVIEDDKTVALYNDLINIKEAAIANELDKIVVPSSRLILAAGGETKTYIIQESTTLDATDNICLKEQKYRDYTKEKEEEMKKVIRQITTLMARTQFTHEKNSRYPFDNFRVIPVSNGPGQRNVDALAAEVINLESGGVGSQANREPFTQGLLKLASTKEQVNIIDNELSKHGILLSTKDVKQRRDEIDVDERLEKFYVEKSVLGNSQTDDRWELYIKDLSKLELNLFERDEDKLNRIDHTWDMRAAVIFILKFINYNLILSKLDRESSIKARRCIDLNLADVNQAFCKDSEGNLRDSWKELEAFQTLGTADGLKPAGSAGDVRDVTEAQRKKLWLPRILQALKSNGQIFDFTMDPKCLHYVIQA